jgi:hypothetical protein
MSDEPTKTLGVKTEYTPRAVVRLFDLIWRMSHMYSLQGKYTLKQLLMSSILLGVAEFLNSADGP